jgi:hypothetical protein
MFHPPFLASFLLEGGRLQEGVKRQSNS